MFDTEKYPEMDSDFERMRKRWYQTENVAFNIIYNIKYHETCFYRPTSVNKNSSMIRFLKINALIYLNKNFERYHFFDEPMNMYHSLAHLPDMPMMAFGFQQKQAQQKEFNDNFNNYVTGYDFLFDIDNQDLRLSYSTATKLKSILDKHQIIYSLRFSGKKGFHFYIEHKDFPESFKKLKINELLQSLKIFTENIKQTENLYDLDTSIVDNRRICKTPYSVVYPHYLIALPLSDYQFETFTIKEVSLPYQLENADKLYLRGNIKRKGNPEAFQGLIDKYLNI